MSRDAERVSRDFHMALQLNISYLCVTDIIALAQLHYEFKSPTNISVRSLY